MPSWSILKCLFIPLNNNVNPKINSYKKNKNSTRIFRCFVKWSTSILFINKAVMKGVHFCNFRFANYSENDLHVYTFASVVK